MRQRQSAPEHVTRTTFGTGQNFLRTHNSERTHILLLSLVAVICLLSGLVSSSGQDVKPTEYEVKAAFVFNFLKFVDWPQDVFAEPGSPIIIGIVSKDPFGPILDQVLRGKAVHGRSLVVRRFATPGDIEFCHVLFVGTSESEEIQRAVKAVSQWKVLTIGDTEVFAQQGGIIAFRMEDTMVRFDINAEVAERAGLRVDSRLLSLARVVKTNVRR